MTRRDAVNGHGAAAPEAAAQGHPEPPWARLAQLHRDLSECYGDLARQAQDCLAERAEQSDITSVKLLTVSDLAERLAVAPKTIRRWRTEGRLPSAIQIGGVVRWDPEVVEHWVKEQSA